MKFFPDINPLASFCMVGHPYMELHIDEYNRVYKKFKNLADDRGYYPLKCSDCDKQVYYYPNYIGLTCIDKKCHRMTMEIAEGKQKEQQRQ